MLVLKGQIGTIHMSYTDHVLPSVLQAVICDDVENIVLSPLLYTTQLLHSSRMSNIRRYVGTY